ncbi:hypothetical protein [Kitasatospora sp. MMS16-BH015]|uniref:hypothetical protein n=1 Tax=Kitasatospora sp. MMS16-BH015 TaxID=2018025 RepID=UPI00131A5002|nr:hypothetical protein [Kitasatospora sp. MMS16-BH015]
MRVQPVETFCCQLGRLPYAEQPEPAPFQADSPHPRLLESRFSEVPPTARVYAEEAGYWVPPP